MTVDRYVLAGALVAAAISIDAWSGIRVLAYAAGAAGIAAVHERLRREFSPAVSTLTSLVLLGGTSLWWSMTHAPAIAETIGFAVAAGAMLWIGSHQSPAVRWTLAGAVAVLGIGIRFLSADAASALTPTITGALFSSSTGWFSLTPAAYFAALGLAFYSRRNRSLAIVSIALLAAWLLALPFTPAGAAGQPFAHGLTIALAVVAPGLASLIDAARARPLIAALPLVAGAVVWNYWLMVQYTVGTLPKDEPVSFAAMVRQQADVHTRSPYVYPFALPANVLFAWREGVPAERFEVLSREPRGATFDLVMDRAADRFLIDGWGGPATTPMGAVRWTAARRSTLVAPLEPSASGGVITLTLAARVEEPAVAVDLGIEVNGVEVQRLTVGPEPMERSMTIPVSGVGASLRAGYNRLTLINYGIHRVDVADDRPFGPLAARSATAAYPIALHRIRIAPAS